MSWAIPADVTDAWLGEGAPTDTSKIQTWIDKAEREIRHRIPDVQARIDAEADEDPARTDLLEAAVDVSVAMVIRVFRNPSGIRQENETTGPFTTSRTYGGDVPGGLMLTEEEAAKLSGAAPGRAFTIDMFPVTSPLSPFYVAADNGLPIL